MVSGHFYSSLVFKLEAPKAPKQDPAEYVDQIWRSDGAAASASLTPALSMTSDFTLWHLVTRFSSLCTASKSWIGWKAALCKSTD
jgi:hypothetical protein